MNYYNSKKEKETLIKNLREMKGKRALLFGKMKQFFREFFFVYNIFNTT